MVVYSKMHYLIPRFIISLIKMPYILNCCEIGAKSNRVCSSFSSGIIPASRPDYFFFNIGKTEVYCEAIYGTAFSWIGPISGRTFAPGESGFLYISGKAYYYTGQKVYNRGDRRALVYCSDSDSLYYYSWVPSSQEQPLKIDINIISKKIVSFGVGKIPYVGEVLSALTDFFWPENEESAWDQVKEQVNYLVDNKIRETIQGILGGDLRYMKEKIVVLKLALSDPNSKDTNRHYMNIAEDLIGFEKKFSFAPRDNSDYKNVNFFLLPMYSTVVNLKVLFYQFGIINQNQIKLTNDDIYNIKKYLTRLIEEKSDGAVVYVNKVFEDQFNYEYDNCDPRAIFNSLAVVRHWSVINGMEFFEFWRAIIKDPFNKKKPTNTAVSYSTYFSRPTAHLSRQILLDEIPVPLQPKLVNGKRNKITKIDVWIFRMGGGTRKIQGLKISYENGESFDCGKLSSETNSVDFKGGYLKSLTVWGWDALDMLEFEFFDGRKEVCGDNYESRGTHQKFELEYHHIAGILITNDARLLGGQAAGIAVSYLLNPES